MAIVQSYLHHSLKKREKDGYLYGFRKSGSVMSGDPMTIRCTELTYSI